MLRALVHAACMPASVELLFDGSKSTLPAVSVSVCVVVCGIVCS